MKTIILSRPDELRLVEQARPEPPGRDEALVRVLHVGICGTDLHAFKGKQNFFTYPRVLGHELAVEIVAIGPSDHSSSLAVGDQCCVIPYLHCGTCVSCRRGKTNCCVDMKVMGVHVDGGMRELITVPLSKLLKAEGIPPEQLALVEMLCIGAHAVTRAQIEAGETALVIGAGPIGLAVARCSQLAGAKVMVMEVNDERLEFCRQVLDIDWLIDGKTDPQAQIRSFLGGELPTLVLDATGSRTSMENAFGLVAHGGKLVFVGHFPGEITFQDPLLHSREMSLLTSRNATWSDFEYIIKMVQTGKINLAPWITHHATPEEIITYFPTWTDPTTGVVKAMLTF